MHDTFGFHQSPVKLELWLTAVNHVADDNPLQLCSDPGKSLLLFSSETVPGDFKPDMDQVVWKWEMLRRESDACGHGFGFIWHLQDVDKTPLYLGLIGFAEKITNKQKNHPPQKNKQWTNIVQHLVRVWNNKAGLQLHVHVAALVHESPTVSYTGHLPALSITLTALCFNRSV